MRAALQLDLGHDRIHGDRGDDTDEPVAGAAAHTRRVGRSARLVDREGGECCAVNREATRCIGVGHKTAAVDPASHSVVADAEQLGGLTDPILRHKMHNNTAFAVLSRCLILVLGNYPWLIQEIGVQMAEKPSFRAGCRFIS